MSVEVRTDGPFIEVRISGVLSNEDFLALAAEARWIDQSEFAGRHRITDISDVTKIEMTFQGLAGHADNRRRVELPNPVKSAIIAPQVAHYGVARMFQTLTDNPKMIIAIFPDADSAKRWLAEPGTAAPENPWTPLAGTA